MKAIHKILILIFPTLLVIITGVFVRSKEMSFDIYVTPSLFLIITYILCIKNRKIAFKIYKYILLGFVVFGVLSFCLDLLYINEVNVNFYFKIFQIALSSAVVLGIFKANYKLTTHNIVSCLVFAILSLFDFFFSAEIFCLIMLLSFISIHLAFIASKFIKNTRIILFLSIVPFLQFLYFIGGNKYIENYINNGSFTGIIYSPIALNPTMYDNAGNKVVLSNDSVYYVIDFWFTECGPCWQEFPNFQIFYNEQHINSLLDIRSVNILNNDAFRNKLFNEKISKFKYTFPVYIGDDNLEKQMKIHSYPTIIIYHNKMIQFRGSLELALQFLKMKKLLI
jgi:thiol-disulfide isomerase/thioredoxin